MSITIPRITQGQATLTKLNAPIQAIQQALNSITTDIATIDNKSAIMQYDATLDSDSVAIGDLVYYDTTTATFRPAIAKLRGVPGEQGQSVQAACSRVQGLVISKQPACILRNGYYQDAGIIQVTLGVGAQAGQYFLSPTQAGKATLNPGWNMRQPCISYYGNGKFSLTCNYLAHDNHHHIYHTIKDTTWNRQLSDSEHPSYGYLAVHVNTSQVQTMAPDVTVLFTDSVLNPRYKAQDDIIWYQSDSGYSDAPQYSTRVDIFNTYPFAYGDSVVRDITSNTLKLKSKNGTYNIEHKDIAQGQLAYSSVAMSSMDNDFKVNYTPVVASLIPGSGVAISNRGSGKYQIASTLSGINQYVPAQQLYMNGTQLQYHNNLQFIVYKQGKQSSCTASLFVNNLDTSNNASYTVDLWLTYRGTASSTTNLAITVYWVPINTSEDTSIQTLTQYTSSITASPSGQEILKQGHVSTGLTIQGSQTLAGGTIVAVVKATNPVQNLYLHKIGFRLNNSTAASASTVDVDLETQIAQVINKYMRFNSEYTTDV